MTIAASEDTFYGTTYYAGPNGSSNTMYLGGWGDWQYVYFQFDVTTMPASASVSSVLLYIYISAVGANDSVSHVRRQTSSWAEGTLTRTNLPTEDTTNRGSLPTTAGGSPRWISVDITALAKEWKDGTYANYGIRLYPTQNTNTVCYIDSRDNASGNAPYLNITYTPSSFIPRGVWIN